MDKYYVFGHTNPDTDSVCASITLANLKRKLGIFAEERVLGNVNKETAFVLNYFKVKEPRFLNDTKVRIYDLNYRKKCYLNEDKSIEEVYNYMIKNNTTGVPIVDRTKNFLGLITAKDILRRTFSVSCLSLETSYDNVLKTLKARGVVRASEIIKGNIFLESYEKSNFSNEDIIIMNGEDKLIENIINSKVKLIILTNDSNIKKEYVKLAYKNDVNIIRTTLNPFEVSRVILYSNFIRTILHDNEAIVIHEKDLYDDFLNKSENLQIDNYPVLDKNGKCVGLLRKSEIKKPNRKKVILVDHNELQESIDGLLEADVTEIVDHHKISAIQTNHPINFRNMIVGSTNTIIYSMYKENNVKITKQMAGLMISAIISDTLLFKSPTTTDLDKKAVQELNKICKLNIKKFAFEMFKAGTSLDNLSVRDVLNRDVKTYKEGNVSVSISQTTTLNYEEILQNKEFYLREMERIRNKTNVDHYLFIITDIIKNGSYVLFDEESESFVKEIFNLKKITNGIFIDKLISRKKQIVPAIIDILEK